MSGVELAPAASAATGDPVDPSVEAQNFAKTQERQAIYDTPTYQKDLQIRDQADANIGKKMWLTAATPAGQDKIATVETDKVGQYLDYANAMVTARQPSMSSAIANWQASPGPAPDVQVLAGADIEALAFNTAISQNDARCSTGRPS